MICLLVYSASFAIGGAARLGELHEPFFKQGGGAQAGALVFLIGGYFARACFLLIAAPLVLLVPVRLQLRHWYGMILAASVPLVLLQNFLGISDLAALRSKIQMIHWYQEAFTALIPALPCALYLWLLHHQVKKLTTSATSRP